MQARDPSGEEHASRRGRAIRLRRLLLGLVLFFALTVPLSWMWIEWGLGRYLTFLLLTAQALHDAVGWQFTGRGAGGLSLRFVSHVPFLVLVLVTPGLSGRRRALGALVGSLLITTSHLLILTLSNAAFAAGRGAVFKISPFILLMDGLPLLIWVVVARDFLRTVVPSLREEPRAGESPD